MREHDNIPKVIHYFWFGGNPLPELAETCIASWENYLPDYEIKRWDESNFDVNAILYTKQAYEAGKYAFVSDYARLKVLYDEGGVYFDTDVEVLRSIDDILENGAFMSLEAMEDGGVGINPGNGIAAPAGLPTYKRLVESYEKDAFLDENGKHNLSTIVTRVTNLLEEDGFVAKNEIQKVGDITIYPTDYFCPKNFATGKVTITKNTYSIHWYDASWQPLSSRVFYAVSRRMPAPLRKQMKKAMRRIKGKS